MFFGWFSSSPFAAKDLALDKALLVVTGSNFE
jgi:hypothetical protein